MLFQANRFFHHSFFRLRFGTTKVALTFYLIAHVVLMPTAWAEEPCDPTTGEATELSETISDAARVAGTPCMFMEAGETSDKYKRLLAEVEGRIRSINQPIMYGPGYDVRGYYREQLASIRSAARNVARELEADFAAAGSDCDKIADLQAATAEFYMGPLKSFHIEYAEAYYDHRTGYDGLGDVYVDVSEQTAGLLSGPWKAILDPNALSSGRLRYSPVVEQVVDIQSRSKVADEQRYLEALQLRLATSELANFATLDALLPDGGKRPCIPDELTRKFPSLRNPDRIVDHRRTLAREGKYRELILPVVQKAIDEAPTLAGPGLVQVLQETDPWVVKHFNPESLDRLVALEQRGAPQLFAAYLNQETATLMTMPEDARRRRIAEIAEQARAEVVTRYVDSVLKIWEQREAGLPESERLWTGFNSPEQRKKRVENLLAYMRTRGANFAAGLELPDVPPFRPGQYRDDYTNSVIPVALAAADLETTADLVKHGMPPSGASLGAKVSESDDGLILTEVPRESAAAAAGLTPGMLITHVNGQPVKTKAQLDRILRDQYGQRAQFQFKTADGHTGTTSADLAMRISPQRGWQILVEPFMDQYPVMEDQVPDNWFRRNIPGISLNYQTRYGDDGTKAVQAFAELLGSGAPTQEQQIKFYVQLGEIENEQIRTQLRAMATRIGLLDPSSPTMERVLKSNTQRQTAVLESLKDQVRTLPIVSQNITWDGQTALGLDWLNPDDEHTFFHLAQSAAQDRVNYYKLQGGRIVVDKEALAAYLPPNQVDAAARRMQRIIDNQHYSTRQARAFLSDLNQRRQAFTRLDNARDSYISAINPDPTPYGYAVTMPEYMLRLNELRNAITGSDMNQVRDRVNAFWHDKAASTAYSPHRSLAFSIDYVVRKATQGEPLSDSDLRYLRDHIKRSRENWDRTLDWSKKGMEQAIGSIESLADQDSVNASLFDWDGDPVNGNAKRVLRDFARERRAEIPSHFQGIDELGQRTLRMLDQALNSSELGRYNSKNEALLQTLPINELSELSASLKRASDQARVHSYVRDAERNLVDVTDELVRDNPNLADLHTRVRSELNDSMVQASIRAAIADVCKTLENLSEQDDLDELRKNLLASVIRQSILQEFPQFEKIDAESEAAFQDYKEKWQKISSAVTTIVITALVVSYFIPGVNLATGSATPWIAGGTGALFAMEAGSGAYSSYKLNDRAAFSEALGTATYNGIMIQNPAITEALRSESRSELMWAGVDLAFAAMEGGRLARLVIGAVQPVGKASQQLSKMGPQIEASMSVGEAERVFTRWAEGVLKAGENSRKAQRTVARAQAALAGWKVSKAVETLKSYGITIPRSPSESAIDRVYKDWLAKHHPDRFAGDTLKQMEAAKRIQEVQGAIQTWKDYAKGVQFLQSVNAGYDQHWSLNPPKALLPPPGGPMAGG